ncbi:hypothetical protein Q0F98_36590 [Paenibacillus amylolyticus]|nr:hypothetical protein Q0F98_36590 [Paenibacillus amylolyticus]
MTLLLPETLPPEKRTVSIRLQKGDHLGKKIWSSFKVPYFKYLIVLLVMTFGLMSYETVFALFAEQKYGILTLRQSPSLLPWARLSVSLCRSGFWIGSYRESVKLS